MLCVQSLSCVQLLVTQRTVAHQSPLSMGFPQQEYWSGLPFPSLGDLSDPGSEPVSPTLECILGEDNGTPLQYSCLENPMEGGAW